MIGEPMIAVICDKCFKDVIVEDAFDVGYDNYSQEVGDYNLKEDFELLEMVVQDYGWVRDGKTKIFCPACADKRKVGNDDILNCV